MKKKLLIASLASFVLVNSASASDFREMSIEQGSVQAKTNGTAGVYELADEMANGVVLKIDEKSAKYTQACFEAFPNGVMPLVYSKSLAENTIMLCNNGYVTTVNKETKTPVYSAEYLNQSMVIMSSQLPPYQPKDIDYKREVRLPETHQVLIDQYESLLNNNSLYAMAELTPPTTQTTELERSSTYYLSNIVPLNRVLRDGLLTRINNGIRKFVYEQAKEGYIVTGTYYEGSSYRIGNVSGAAVPAYIYKAFYFPTLGIASAYWIKNDEVNKFDVISINELTKRVKVDVFPDLPATIKSKIVYPPRPYKGDDSYLGDLKRLEDVDVNFYINNDREKKVTELQVVK